MPVVTIRPRRCRRGRSLDSVATTSEGMFSMTTQDDVENTPLRGVAGARRRRGRDPRDAGRERPARRPSVHAGDGEVGRRHAGGQRPGRQGLRHHRVRRQAADEAAVHLGGTRCDGSAHGGCQAGCLLFWKEEWLRPDADEPSPAEPADDEALAALSANTRGVVDGTERFYCQATELRAPRRRCPGGGPASSCATCARATSGCSGSATACWCGR